MILTATATLEVKNEFLKILHNPIQEITRVNKGNISLHVKELKIVPKKGKIHLLYMEISKCVSILHCVNVMKTMLITNERKGEIKRKAIHYNHHMHLSMRIRCTIYIHHTMTCPLHYMYM